MLDVRYLATVALLALVPVALFILDRSETVVAIALVNVLIISASVYLMFSGGEDHAHGDHARPPAGET